MEGEHSDVLRLVDSLFHLKCHSHCLKDDSLCCLTDFSSDCLPLSLSSISRSTKAPFSLLTVCSSAVSKPPSASLSLSLSVSLPSLYSPRVEFNKCRCRERETAREGEREWGEREKRAEQSRAERINDERSGRLSVCVCVHVSARVCLINAVSIRRREWEGEKNTGYSYRRRQRLGRAREKQRREGGES